MLLKFPISFVRFSQNSFRIKIYFKLNGKSYLCTLFEVSDERMNTSSKHSNKNINQTD